MSKIIKNDLSNSENFKNDEIDIGTFFNFVFRNKILIGSFSFFFFLFACAYSLTLKRIWAGEFQIVLNSEQNSNFNFSNFSPIVENLVDVDKDLSTQVGILESPSVLMPIFDYYKSNYKSDPTGKNEQSSFSSWKGNLKIALEKGTRILKISYKDTNKEAILNVLEKVSNVYQEYSGRGSRRNKELLTNFLKEQVNIYKLKSADSLKKAQSFAIDQDLIFMRPSGSDSGLSKGTSLGMSNLLDLGKSFNGTLGFTSQMPTSSENFVVSNVEVENIRASAANKIRLIDLQIKKIEDLGDDTDKLQFIGASIVPLEKEGLPQKLADIQSALIEKESLFTNDDPSVIRLKEKRDLLIKELKKRSIGYLKAERLEAEALRKSAIRPKGVLLKYKELIREAERDEATLIDLENKLIVSEINQAKIDDPWKLITEPTLLKMPVGPKRKNIGFTGLILGFLIGSLLSFLKEKKSGKVFDFQIVRELLSSPLIEEIEIENNITKTDNILFLKKFIKSQPGKKVYLITLEEREMNYCKKLAEFLLEEGELAKEIQVLDASVNYDNFFGDETIILMLSFENTKYIDLEILKKRLKLLNVKLNGFLLLKN